MDKFLKKRDIIYIICVFLVLAVLVFISYYIIFSKAGSVVEVSVDDSVIGTYDINVDKSIPIYIDGTLTNTVVIEDGTVYMQNANCPDKLCVYQGRINNKGQSICCLPNHVLVSVKGDDGYDSIAK